MFKISALILICAVCMGPAVEGAAAGVAANSSTVKNLNPREIDILGNQIGVPLLTPNYGPLTSLFAAALPSRSYVAQSNPVLVRTPCSDRFIGEASLGLVVI